MTDKEFTLKYIFKDVGKLGNFENLFSPEEEHFGVNWKIIILKLSKNLAMYLYTNVTENQRINANWTAKICSQNKTHSISGSGDLGYGSFRFTNDFIGYYYWVTFIDREKEYLNDGKLEVEIHVKINEMIGFPKEKLRSFGEDMKQFSDVILKVEDRKFYVSKLYLSSQSPYFATLFLGKFQESEKSEIELKDVKPDDFQYYLEVIYAEDAINDDTVVGVLQIADMYETPLAIKKCEKYLIKGSKLRLKKRLELAAKYRLEELKKKYLIQFNRLFKTTVAADEGSRQVTRKRARI